MSQILDLAATGLPKHAYRFRFVLSRPAESLAMRFFHLIARRLLPAPPVPPSRNNICASPIQARVPLDRESMRRDHAIQPAIADRFGEAGLVLDVVEELVAELFDGRDYRADGG